MELKLGVEILESYKRLAYKVWFGLAEFVDNSTQSFENNRDLMTKLFAKEKTILRVKISYDTKKDYMEIEDNSIGMDESDLQNALTIGKPPVQKKGRSRYGLGLKTAAFWFGDKWEIRTKKYGSKKEYRVTVDLEKLLEAGKKKSKGGRQLSANTLKMKETPKPASEHYTIIRITKLHRSLPPKTVNKTKDYLKSIYRYDLKDNKLALIFQDEILTWNEKDIFARLLTDENDNPFYKTFSFKVGSRTVSGWAGVLATGSRRDAGFSLLQANRVIQGWPDSYRPERLFGEMEGGRNDLANQRLLGELHLNGFNVSHTKDEILFSEDEEDQLDKELFKVLADYRIVANEYRKGKQIEDIDVTINFSELVPSILGKLQHNKNLAFSITEEEVLTEDIIKASNEELYSRMVNQVQDTYVATIAGIRVTVMINQGSSVYDPYLVIRIKAKANEVGIVINRNHPHWAMMSTEETIENFIKHCIYDGLSEWKAIAKIGNISPDTIKMIKDSYLRHPLTLE